MAAQTNRLKPQVINPVFTDADLSKYNSIVSLAIFHFYDFFDWWYVRMPIQYMRQLSRVMEVANDQLSITLLLRTFFVPWHRDTKPIGYLMGITMRLIYLPVAIIIYLALLIFAFLFVVFWILLPMITLIFIVITPIL